MNKRNTTDELHLVHFPGIGIKKDCGTVFATKIERVRRTKNITRCVGVEAHFAHSYTWYFSLSTFKRKYYYGLSRNKNELFNRIKVQRCDIAGSNDKLFKKYCRRTKLNPDRPPKT